MVNICLIGIGRAGMIHGRNMAGKIKNARLIALCDPMEENLQKAQSELAVKYLYRNYHDALANDEIDAIVIVTPTAYHKEIAIAAAQAKKHILCEKPLAMDEQECQEVIAAAKTNNVKLQVGFMRRFDANFQEAKKAVVEGAIGDVTLIKSLTHGPSQPKEWMYDISISSGPIGEVNSHDLDTLRWIANDEVASIYAIGGNFRSPEVKENYPDYYDTVSMNIKFESGILGAIDGAQYVQYGYDARAEVLGTKGSILIGDPGKNNVLIAQQNHQMTRSTMNSWTYLFREAYIAEDQAFVDCILEDTIPLVTGYDGLMAVKLVHAGLTSLLNNRIEYIS
ncbi:hypothetical protein TEHD86_0824 [Tetragenococcus halophilus subsp. halophilus]|uniref:Gfo/Idh/MocA family oxidoreductase n=1 Tax=Tetragenococcus halophilus TaxID=51669 RepID=UPI000CA91475|nr:Gfo/Idh/MocA family oxidoreductase [Tetragenococcus halophilus]MDN6731306.1 Gfo/Idh/MocA family oxidoreductase [Atopostipes suicloacalis]MCO8287709.1 Gfo/Idh/MocA family oxidoreductase [Tetragenococcus halophilus]NWO01242.1 Gfo/Idh/MocA family oxidoreductase [Tetragenococcus halophilus]GBD81047.1 hypothetical protein TEHD10_2110 [Tetragenococcus halophilus subsp. halophilus]GBD82102.1 hypothetical protein TEHD86_0824 [Tetragenococcus halophilus subsp. halophilus]